MSAHAEPEGSTSYLFDTGSDLGDQQMRVMPVLLDPLTLDVLDATGVGPGARCLELGAGGGSIARALAERAGPSGRVVAVDLATDYLEDIPGVEVYRHDITQGLPDPGPFDLIHARLVLLHLPQRLEVLRTLVDALAPGGWLVLGEYSGRLPYASAAPTEDELALFDRVMDIGHHVIGAGAGQSLRWAHEAPEHLLNAGLTNVHSREYSFTTVGGDTACRYIDLLVRQIAPPLLSAGLSEGQLTRFHELMLDPRFRGWFYQFVGTRGQKPSSGGASG
ncbi:class I SAM-dependent methyltransferase [Actinomadura darangshiensis]|uniref:Class I SAM-dependent methyltransferase n=1 Tax=Actinomadura darangshiensis TaxID=705336 RepID=A0A4V2YUJ0_9ACTN|nr:class I SAM-dependent methyltransferase [Actinomadura darangshiensis]TDD77977.1 class I SAM-dependent methyltransferase [Actinomadura darangshiensis]